MNKSFNNLNNASSGSKNFIFKILSALYIYNPIQFKRKNSKVLTKFYIQDYNTHQLKFNLHISSQFFLSIHAYKVSIYYNMCRYKSVIAQYL